MGLRLGLGALLLAPSVIEWRHSAGFALSHYTVLAGGTPGAADKGMNRVFWGHNSAQLAPYFNKQLPQGGSVWIGDSSPAAWYFLQRDHKLAPNITPASDLASADFVIVDEEHHFAEVRYQAWQAFGSVAPLHILAHDGVPILTVYKNPHGRGKD